MNSRAWVAVLAVVALVGVPLGARIIAPRFDHPKHKRLFVACQTCHLGASEAGQQMWPPAAGCAACHDGTVAKVTEWQPPSAFPTNLRFTHQKHAEEIRAQSADSTVDCTACHSVAGAEWMTVQRAAVENCLTCHGVVGPHLDARDSACATCHVPLWQATVPMERVARWEAPTSHRESGFEGSGHARVATGASCATCHARDYCAACHVNATEQPAIMALASDPRALAIAVPKLAAPTSHHDPGFLSRHGQGLVDSAGVQRCANCHTQESCTACHLVAPAKVRLLPVASVGRAVGAPVTRRRPAGHGPDYADGHGPAAAASPQTCAGCHVREQCLDCHRPNPAGKGRYHPADFMSRHPVGAYGAEVTCGSCHNTGQFCQTCHQQSGVVATRPIGGGGVFHDAKGAFVLGHGQPARQSLESCVSCHTERDCLACHSAQTRRFNPHGPGFDAERLRKRNSQMCSACHGSAIPSP